MSQKIAILDAKCVRHQIILERIAGFKIRVMKMKEISPRKAGKNIYSIIVKVLKLNHVISSKTKPRNL